MHIDFGIRIEALLARFRASGRLFWIAGILALYVAIARIALMKNRRLALALMAFSVFVQIVDVLGVATHTKREIAQLEKITIPISPELSNGATASSLQIHPPWQCDPDNTPFGIRGFEVSGQFTLTNHIPTNSYYAGRTPKNHMQFHCDSSKRLSTPDPRAIYVLSDDMWAEYGYKFRDSHKCRISWTNIKGWICN